MVERKRNLMKCLEIKIESRKKKEGRKEKMKDTRVKLKEDR